MWPVRTTTGDDPGVPEPVPAAARELAPDRERDAGFRGEAYTKAAWLFGLVFLAGFAVVAMVLAGRRRRRAQAGP